MAAKLASQGGARSGGERQEAGPCQSYASVLNPKGASQNRANSFKSNNKENIDDQVAVPQQQQQHLLQQQQHQTTTNAKEKIVPSVKGGKSYQRITRCPQTVPNSCPERRDHHENSSSMPVAHVDVVSLASPAPGASREDDGQNDAERLNNGSVGNDGEFQTVATKGARRKEKLREQYRENHRERHRLRDNNNRHQPPPRGPNGVGGGGAGRRGSDERSHRERADRNGVLEHGPKEAHHYKEDQSIEPEAQSTSLPPPPVKYVEAPLPAVNPWTRNRISAAQTAKTLPLQQQQQQQQPSNVVATSTCIFDKQSERERRVLQPQQQQQQDATVSQKKSRTI